MREYKAKHLDSLRKYKRDWNRKKRGTDPKMFQENRVPVTKVLVTRLKNGFQIPEYTPEQIAKIFKDFRDQARRAAKQEAIWARERQLKSERRRTLRETNIKLLSTVFGLPENCVISIFPKNILHGSKLNKQSYNKYSIWSGAVLPKVIRKYIFERDNYTCQYCGKDGTTITKDTPYVDLLCIDHKNPMSRFGINHNVNNLITSCIRCNSKKSIKTYEEYVGLKI